MSTSVNLVLQQYSAQFGINSKLLTVTWPAAFTAAQCFSILEYPDVRARVANLSRMSSAAETACVGPCVMRKFCGLFGMSVREAELSTE